MKITHIGSVLLQPFPWVLVNVTTDEGITGIGEAYHTAIRESLHSNTDLVEESLWRPV